MADRADHVSGMRVLSAHTGAEFESGALHRPHPDTGGRLHPEAKQLTFE